jgi:MoaA/NifB/PqqE/SkfB family radical SAM enzyme
MIPSVMDHLCCRIFGSVVPNCYNIISLSLSCKKTKVQEGSFSVLTTDELHPVWTREELLQQKDDEFCDKCWRYKRCTESRIARHHTSQAELTKTPSVCITNNNGNGS